MPIDLPVLNLNSATYECTFGRGCDGICCREGRPLVYADEIARIGENLAKFLPLMRPDASKMAARKGFLSGRRRLGQRARPPPWQSRRRHGEPRQRAVPWKARIP